MRVAVTGLGVVSSIGIGKKEFIKGMKFGKACLTEISDLPIPRGKKLAGLILNQRFQGNRRCAKMAEFALKEAISEATLTDLELKEAALIVSTNGGDSATAENIYKKFVNAMQMDLELKHAMCLYSNGTVASSLASKLGIKGPRLTLSNACASGNIAMGVGLDLIRLGRVRTVLVVGAELVKLSNIWGADRAGILGRRLRPFHPHRDGTILGEGAGALILRHPEDLHQNTPIGWLEGFGCNCDKGAADLTFFEDGSGIVKSMKLALEDAHRDASEIQYVNAHAPGTKVIDQIDMIAVSKVCKSHSKDIYINSTKALTAHLSAATTIVENIATLLQMKEGFLHSTPYLDKVDEELVLQPILGPNAIKVKVNRAVSNSLGGGGVNSSVFLSSGEQSGVKLTSIYHNKKRVVVTGVASISPSGINSQFLNFTTPPPKHENDLRLNWFEISKWFKKESNYQYKSRAAQLAAAVGVEALKDSKLILEHGSFYPHDEIAVIAGTHFGGGPQASQVICRTFLDKPESLLPSDSLDHGVHLGAALVARFYNITGLTYTFTGSNLAGLQAIVMGIDALKLGRAKAVLTLGYDAMDEALLHAVKLMRAKNNLPLLGEAAGGVVLENLEIAKEREAQIYSEILHTVIFSGRFSERVDYQEIKERFYNEFREYHFDVVFLTGTMFNELDEIAVNIRDRRSNKIEIKCLQPWTNLCLGGDGHLAISCAIFNNKPSLVIGATPEGDIIGLHLCPFET